MHLHTEIYANIKSIFELFKMNMKSLDSFILATLGYLRLYGDSRDSRAQPRINAYEILLQHDWLFFSSTCRYNRFAETHSYLQLSYQITDQILYNKLFMQYLWILAGKLPKVKSFATGI